MPTEQILVGPATNIVQNQVYALPAKLVSITSTRVMQVSVDNSTFSDVTATTSGTTVTGIYTKCTTGAAVLVAKA